MLYALFQEQKRTSWPGARARCPGCHEEVMAKCGDINIWHWSHIAQADCDPWYEPESAWHLGWKAMVSPSQCEVVRATHRADIITPHDYVVELQHSALTPYEVREREAFYGTKLVWLINATDFEENLSMRSKGGYHTFRWRWPRKWMWGIQRTMIWDLEDGLFQVRKLYDNVPCGGWGQYIDRNAFIKWLNGNPTHDRAGGAHATP